MFDVSSDLGFQTLDSSCLYIFLTIAQRSARSRSHGYVPPGIATLVFRSLLKTLIARIGKDTFLFAVQQVVRLGNIMFICCGGVDTVDYRRAIINYAPSYEVERWGAHFLHGGRSWGHDHLGRRVDVP